MHEVGIMEQTLALATDRARAEGATQIHRLIMRVGTLSGVVPEALQFAFDALAKESIAAGAAFQIDTVPARCACDRCGTEFEPEGWLFECPDCHHISSHILQGKELELTSLEVS